LEKTVEEIIDSKESIHELNLTSKIYKSLFDMEIGKFKLGSLKITNPDGSVLLFGDITQQYQAFGSAHIHIKNYSFYKRCVFFGDIGFAESYLNGEWETDSISEVISFFILNVENNPSMSGSKKSLWRIKFFNFFNRLIHKSRDNTVTGSKKNIVEHYDLGNEFYKLFLDKSMTYSSGIFQSGKETLEEAQIAKYENICKNIGLNSTHHILEIGSGWGGFSIYAASKYGCKITTLTISDEQFKFAKNLIEEKKLSHLIEIKLCDYRLIEGNFDRIVSIEMLEAVGDKFFEVYFAKCHEVLKPGGMLAFQVITSPDSRYEEFKTGIDYIQKYIFPGSLLPSVARINQAINRTGSLGLFRLEDMGSDYAKTLKLWLEQFDKNISEVRKQGFDEKFIRNWRYYLSYCSAAFQMRNISVVQMVYTRPNNLTI
jgi:cyclopropane-fatty-acyl-phospholipid synthase